MTLPQVLELTAYWHSHPPVHLLLAAWLQYKPKASTTGAVDALLALAPGGVCRLDQLRGA